MARRSDADPRRRRGRWPLTSVTRRDEAWHAVIITAVETGKTGTFRLRDVVENARALECAVSRRTIMKVIAIMVELGYLDERDRGRYAPAGPFVADMAVEVVRPREWPTG